MPKIIEGYFLDNTTGAGIAAAPVTLYDANTNAALTGTQAFGLTANPTSTDGVGHFKFTMDLAPGPVYVKAVAPAGDVDYRYGLEQMQVADHWMSDLGTLLRAFSDGVIAGSLSQFAVTVSGSVNQYTVGTGYALVEGYTWGLSQTYTATISANTTLPNRRSIVVLRQYIGGPYQGKQVIDILYGNVDATDPTVRQNVTVGSDVIWEFPLARLNTAQNASVSTILADLRAYSGLGMNILDGGVPVVGSARGIDFFGASFIITDEGGGVGLITPSFGTGSNDFKRGNAQGSGIAKNAVFSTSYNTNIGNAGEVEIAHVDVTLNPLLTYDAVVDGSFIINASGATSASAWIRCSLDVPFQSLSTDKSEGGATGVTSGSGAGQAVHQHVALGISGVSTIRAYLYGTGITSTTTIIGYQLKPKFFARG